MPALTDRFSPPPAALGRMNRACARWWAVAAGSLGRVAADWMPALCPLCRAAVRPAGAVACDACLDALAVLPRPRCPACGGGRDGVLAQCSECLQFGERPWQHAVSAFVFRDAVRQAVHRLKYQGDPAVVPVLAAAMAADWQEHGREAVDVVTPVPLHWWRQCCRGYNQAELLARQVAGRLGLPCERLLRRRRHTAQQARLAAEARPANVQDVFARRRGARIAGRHVLLVDDVLTTGATLGEAARVLTAAQAAKVSVLTAARG